jgi:hypothetical protein
LPTPGHRPGGCTELLHDNPQHLELNASWFPWQRRSMLLIWCRWRSSMKANLSPAGQGLKAIAWKNPLSAPAPSVLCYTAFWFVVDGLRLAAIADRHMDRTGFGDLDVAALRLETSKHLDLHGDRCCQCA